jgi:pyrroline-5-carboxylate reductase
MATRDTRRPTRRGAPNSLLRMDTAFIGCGNLGMAILSRALRAGVLVPSSTLVVERDAGRRGEAEALGARATMDAADARSARTVVLAVKPQHFEEAARALGALDPDTCVVSVMAGWSSAAIRASLGGAVRVVRAMPNTPAQVGLGMTAIAPGAGARPEDVRAAERLFSAVGAVAEIREEEIDAAVAAVGSAPAYLFLLAEAQVAAARAMGIDADTARTMTAETMLGAATLLARDGRSAGELRAAVTSAGGTTAAAIRVFEERGFAATVAAAMEAARARSVELGK